MEVQATSDRVRSAGESLLNSGNQAKAGDSLGKEDFLRLLMTQMTNQDPLNPLDSQGMMAQFAQMGSLEQLTNINQQLGELNRTQGQIVRSTAASYLEKDVTVQGGAARVNDGRAPAVQYKLSTDANVAVKILDEGGSPVRMLELGFLPAGSHRIEWDGVDNDGDLVPNGRYSYDVDARASDDTTVPVDLYVSGKISGVRFADGRQYIRMNGEEYGLDEVVSLSNESERLFGSREPIGPRNTMTPMPPVLDRTR